MSEEPSNPFQAPRERGTTSLHDPDAEEAAPLASRTARLWGSFVDALVTGAPMGIVEILYLEPVYEQPIWRVTWEDLTGDRGPLMQAATWWWIGMMFVQWALITRTGRSLGKFLVGIRIVTTARAAPGFLHGVALREWPMYALYYVPLSGGFADWFPTIVLLEVLPIFGPSRRCGHDYIASTIVVEYEAPEQSRVAPPPPVGPIGA